MHEVGKFTRELSCTWLRSGKDILKDQRKELRLTQEHSYGLLDIVQPKLPGVAELGLASLEHTSELNNGCLENDANHEGLLASTKVQHRKAGLQNETQHEMLFKTGGRSFELDHLDKTTNSNAQA